MMLRTRGAEREDGTAPTRDVVVLRRIATACSAGIAQTAICARSQHMGQLHIRRRWRACEERCVVIHHTSSPDARVHWCYELGYPPQPSRISPVRAVSGCSCTAHTRKIDGTQLMGTMNGYTVS